MHSENDFQMSKVNIDLRGLIQLGKMSGGYFFTTFVKNAIPLLVLPILTRYLAPQQYANVALFSFCLALSNALTGVSIPTVIAKHFFDSDKKQVAKLIGSSLFILAVFSLAALLLIVLSYPFLRKIIDLKLFWLILVPFTSFAFVVFSIGLTVMRNEKKSFLFGKHQIGNTAIDITVSLVMVVLFLWGWQGRVGGIIISYFISALLMAYYLRSNKYVLFAISKKSIKNVLSTGLPLIPYSFQSVVIFQVGLLFIQFYFSKEILGLYAVAMQVAFAVKLLYSALELSWSPYLYEQLAKKHAINKVYLTRMLLALVAVMSLGVLFIIIFAGIVLRIMTSKQYFGAREFIPWFAVGYFFNGLYLFLMPFLIKFEKQRYISKVSFMNMIIMIVLNVWFVNVFGYIGTAYAFSIIYFLIFLAFAWKAQKVFPLPWLRALKVWN
jgi:O-antigen/teichoic acid export membrane protein